MFCWNCGMEIGKRYRYCPYCGKPVAEELRDEEGVEPVAPPEAKDEAVAPLAEHPEPEAEPAAPASPEADDTFAGLDVLPVEEPAIGDDAPASAPEPIELEPEPTVTPTGSESVDAAPAEKPAPGPKPDSEPAPEPDAAVDELEKTASFPVITPAPPDYAHPIRSALRRRVMPHVSGPLPQMPEAQPYVSGPYEPSAYDAQASSPAPAEELPPEAQPLASATPKRARRSEARPVAVAVPVIAIALVAVIAVALAATGVIGGDSDKVPVTPPAASVEVQAKANLEDYSWTELSQISDKIAAASSDEEGLSIARTYNLVDASGKISPDNTKTLTLSDGTSVPVQVAGFRHDPTTGGGISGVSFVTAKVIGERAMNSGATNAGGWEQSQLRTWLNDSFVSMLPGELQGELRAVDKWTNNVGSTQGATAVTATSDRIWVPSLAEVGGQVAANNADIYNAEGNVQAGVQYQLFSDNGATQTSISEVLSRAPWQWWLRSPTPSTGDGFMSVRSVGEPGFNDVASNPHGVVIGFCL